MGNVCEHSNERQTRAKGKGRQIANRRLPEKTFELNLSLRYVPAH